MPAPRSSMLQEQLDFFNDACDLENHGDAGFPHKRFRNIS